MSPGGRTERLSPFDRVLGIFTEVRPGEGAAATALLASIFLLLAANYFVKPARDGLLAVSGIPGLSDLELKAYSSFGQSLLLLAVLPLYARLSNRLDRRRLIHRVTLFFLSNLFVFWALQPGWLVERVPYLGIAFYLWVGIFNLFVVAQFWAFAADLYGDERGRRLLPAIAIGAAAGAATGAWLAKEIVRPFGTFALLLVAAGCLAGALALMIVAESRESPPSGAPRAKTGGTSGALRLVFGHRYLLATAVAMLLLNWTKTNSDNLLFAVVQEVLQLRVSAEGLTDPSAIERFVGDQTTAFYGDFFFWVNLGALLLQAFLASRVLRYGGFAPLLLLLPVVATASYSALAFLPMLWLFRVTKIAEDSLNYSLHNTAMQVLWLPTTSEMKYKGKTAIDTVFVRAGDGMAALTAFAGIQLLSLSTSAFFALNAVLAVGWVVTAVVIARQHRRLVEDARRGF